MKKILVLVAGILFSVGALAAENFDAVLSKNFTEPAIPVSQTKVKLGTPKVVAVYPTFFFVEGNGRLYQLARIKLSAAGGNLVIRAERPGNLVYDNPIGVKPESIIKIPDLRENAELTLKLLDSGKEIQTLKYSWRPERLWKVYISFVSHFDLGYTDYQDKVALKRNKITETALGYAEQTKDWPEDARYRWTAEASWEIKNFLKDHPEKVDVLKKLAQEGRLEVTAKLSHMHSETAGYEELFRELYYSKLELEPMLGVEIVTADETDVDGYTWGEASVLPGSGVKYFLFNPNWSYRGGNIVHDTKFPQAFWWQGPDAAKILAWRSYDSYGEAPFLLKGYGPTVPGMTKLLKTREKNGYPYDALHLTRTGPEWDNTIPKLEPCQAIREWDEDFAYPRLISATPKMFFAYMEKNYADKIPVGRGDMPDWWADGVITEAKEEGISRELHHRLFELESLAATASVLESGYSYPVKEIDNAFYNNILFDEHTWGFNNPRKPEHKKMFGTKAGWLHEAYDQTAKMSTQVFSSLAEKVAPAGQSLLVFNPLSWPRSEVVRFNWTNEAAQYVKIIDPETGSEIPAQFVEDGAAVKVWFIARDLPAFGYKSYKLVPAQAMPSYPATVKAGENKMENDRLALSFGKDKWLASVKDKKLDRELLDGDAGKFIYREQDADYSIIDFRKAASVKSVSFASGPVFATARLSIKDPANPAADLVQEIRLADGLDWIDVSNHYSNYSNKLDEARYFEFPFKVPDFEMQVETPYSRMRPYYDQLPDFAKFYVVAHSIILKSKSDNFAVVWSTDEAPMVELGEITKLANHLVVKYRPGKYPWNPDKPTVYSEIMNNYQITNFSFNQSGSADWRYRIAALAPDEMDKAHQSGWELDSPAIAMVVEKDATRLRQGYGGQGFLKVDPADVMVTEFKMAEDGSGYIIRVYEAEGKAAKATLEFPIFKLSGAWLTNGVEKEQSKLVINNGKVELDLSPFEIKTIKVKLAR